MVRMIRVGRIVSWGSWIKSVGYSYFECFHPKHGSNSANTSSGAIQNMDRIVDLETNIGTSLRLSTSRVERRSNRICRGVKIKIYIPVIGSSTPP